MKKLLGLTALLVILFNQFILAGNGKPSKSSSLNLNVIAYSQGNWGGQKSDELAMICKVYFPEGLKIGSDNTLVLSSPQAIEEFLPSGTSAKPFPFGQMTDPGLTYKNMLAGELVALSLNLALDHYRKDGFSTLINMEIKEGEMQGKTVEDLYKEANRKLGGGYSVYSFNILTEALYAVNRNFIEPGINRGFLIVPTENNQFAEGTVMIK
ncbi:MAG: hypothetical protein IPP71_17940 [Bacteroidetes bacterium]|nr:hypothetical protein [Bacteroidota bacterium]